MYVLITVTLRIFFFVCERVNHPSLFFSFFFSYSAYSDYLHHNSKIED